MVPNQSGRVFLSIVAAVALIALGFSTTTGAAKPTCPGHPNCKDDGGSGETQAPDPALVMVAYHSKGVLNELLVTNVDGSNQSVLKSSETDGYFWPAWSPTWSPSSGNELAFMNRRGTQGSGPRKIVRYDLSTDTETVIVQRKGYHLFEPDWRQYIPPQP